MNGSDRQKLIQIRTYCEDIKSFTERFGNSFDIFVNDRAYYNAVCMCILQIGELANSLSDELKKNTSNEIPWDMVRGMRNLMAHVYAEMDESIIWDTVENDIPYLFKFCDKYTKNKT